MTQDEIIEMARQVGLPHWYQTKEVVNIELLERFAKLVAQHEREQVAQFIETGYVRQFENPWRDDLSAAIRARGQA
jgi:hypothetical protein